MKTHERRTKRLAQNSLRMSSSAPAAPPPTSATGSAVCKQFQPDDALLVLNVQNSFMEKREVRAGVTPRYGLPANWTSAGEIPAGPLPVPGSSGIIDVVNAWIDFAKAGTVIATLDYHPPTHCSFCDIMDGGIKGGTYCIRGVGQSPDVFDLTFNESHVCLDEISAADFASATYFQWAPHSVAATVDARVDPYVALPDDAIVVKLGTQQMRDDYSAFAPSARVSTAPAGTHDMQPDANANLAPASRNLVTELEKVAARRLFLVGLATDYVVKRTAYAALAQKSGNSSQWTVALLSAATRGIVPSPSAQVLDEVKNAANGHVLVASDPVDAMDELCAGTCDAAVYTTQCAPGEFCQNVSGRAWGECASCGCLNGGSCQPDGSCLCVYPYAGPVCDGGMTREGLVLTASALSVLVALALAPLIVFGFVRLRRWWRARGRAKLHEQAELEASAERDQRAQEAERHECSFWFVSAAQLLESTEKSLPSFVELQKRGHGFLSRHTITRDGAFRGSYSRRYVAVSHRWFARDSPDKDGQQLNKIKAYLRAHPEVQWVWYDYWCMPQGNRSPAQRVSFDYMLQHVNYLYLGCSVLVLLDLSYLSRFWTQFEAWLSFQVPSPQGLAGMLARSSSDVLVTTDDAEANLAAANLAAASHAHASPGGIASPARSSPTSRRRLQQNSGRCTVVPIYNANTIICSYLRAMWAEKTPAEAHEILAKEDVTVTSLKDKEMHLPKILRLNEEIMNVLSGAPPPAVDRDASADRLERALLAAAIADNAVKLETARAEAVKARAEAAHAELEKAEEELKRLEKVEKELEGTMSMSKIEQSLSEQQRSQVNWRDLGPLSV